MRCCAVLEGEPLFAVAVEGYAVGGAVVEVGRARRYRRRRNHKVAYQAREVRAVVAEQPVVKFKA